MSFRGLFAVFIAVAVLLAPAFTRAGEVYAAVPDHHMQMMETGNCASPGTNGGDDPESRTCCIAMCMAVAAAPLAPPEVQPLPRSAATFGLVSFQVGLPDEIATPPPRAA